MPDYTPNHPDWLRAILSGTRILRVIHGRDARATLLHRYGNLPTVYESDSTKYSQTIPVD